MVCVDVLRFNFYNNDIAYCKKEGGMTLNILIVSNKNSNKEMSINIMIQKWKWVREAWAYKEKERNALLW